MGITTETTALWDDRASFRGVVRPGATRQHEVYEALHPATASLMGIKAVNDPLFIETTTPDDKQM